MILTPALLIAATGCKPAFANVDHLNRAMAHYAIDTPIRAAHFLAQSAHESAGFSKVEENMNYTPERLCIVWPTRFYLPPDQPKKVIGGKTHTRQAATAFAHSPVKLANTVYANRMGNDDAASGDGWKYRGRGYIQLTGRSAYAALHDAHPNLPSISYPDVVTSAEGAAWSAAWFWHHAGCSDMADINAVSAVTHAVAGSMRTLKERTALTERAMTALGAAP